METTKTQLTDFLNKCEEVKNCKFIMATTKIKDLLKSIVNSAELYELFNTVAANFDYVAAKQQCFVETDAPYSDSRLVLPDTVGDRLAFIFCLLVEFDRNDINFNAFLQKYYPKDGSYYTSYHLFCDEIIGSLEAIIVDVFSAELAEPQPAQPLLSEGAKPASLPLRGQSGESRGANTEASTLINAIGTLIESERAHIEASTLGEEEKEAARNILSSLDNAVRAGDGALIKALTCGYNYFVMYTVFVSDSVASLFEAVGEYLSVL